MECVKMELKPRNASAGKFAGKIRHNQEPLFDDEFKQMVVLTKTEDKEEQLLFIFNLLKIKPSTDRTATTTATANKSKVAEYIAKLDKYMSDCEAINPELKIDEPFVRKLLSKCTDEPMRKALEQHYFKVAVVVVQKVPEFTF